MYHFKVTSKKCHFPCKFKIKRTLSPKLSKGFVNGCEDIKANQRYFVYGGDDHFPINAGTRVVSLKKMLEIIDSI